MIGPPASARPDAAYAGVADLDDLAEHAADAAALAAALRAAVAEQLTAHQRLVLVSLAVNDVPVDVLAERLGTSRGALYKTLHDARSRLRAALAAAEFDVDVQSARSRS